MEKMETKCTYTKSFCGFSETRVKNKYNWKMYTGAKLITQEEVRIKNYFKLI